MNKDLAVIILSYNTIDITDECLRRATLAAKYCEQQLKNKVQLVAVDNGSTDNSAEMISRKHKQVTLVSLDKNTGFAGGNNLAMKAARQDYLLLLNSDAYLEKETLAKAIIYMEKNNDCDVLGCRLKYADGRMQPSGGFLPNPINTVWWMMGFNRVPGLARLARPTHPKSKNFFSNDREMEWVMGAFLLLRRKVFEKTGGFDENFFMYMEEVEWCYRMQQAGFKICYTPSFEITHLDKASSGFDLRKPLIREMQGIKYFIKRHYPGSWWWVMPFLYVGSGGRMIAYTLKGDTNMANIYAEILRSI
jgi:GT2 family glycosyltransferase